MMEKPMGPDHTTTEKLATQTTLDSVRPGEVVLTADARVDASVAKELRQTLEASRQGGYIPISAEEKAAHRRLNRKLDLFVIPFLVCIYLFNGLDRSNIGNAQTAGFSTDLNLPSTAVNTATSLFFATYVPLQPFSAAIGKRIGQTYWLGFIGTCWGILTLGHAFIKTQSQLLAVRLLIGVFEAGFYPTVITYLSRFYPRYDLAFRIGLFTGSYAIAGAFGGIIAYGTFQIKGSLYTWQYLFIIEGVCSITLALFAPFWLPRSVGTAWFLGAEDRKYAENRMLLDSASNGAAISKLTRRDLIEGLLDWKLWLILPFAILASVPQQGFTIFFPVVVKGLGYSGATANLMTVPPYVIGTLVLLCLAFSSDHFHNRVYHILISLAILMVGLIMTVTVPLENTGARYAGLVILLAGTFTVSPITTSWLAGNTPEPGKRTVVIGLNGWGNLAGVIGSEIFLSKYSPAYIYPLKITLAMIAVAFVGFAGNAAILFTVNKYKARRIAAMQPEEIEEEIRNDKRYADKKWTFVYGL